MKKIKDFMEYWLLITFGLVLFSVILLLLFSIMFVFIDFSLEPLYHVFNSSFTKSVSNNLGLYIRGYIIVGFMANVVFHIDGGHK